MRWYPCTPGRFLGNRSFFERDPGAISAAWCEVFHPGRVAAAILQLS
jgi:hypothetical protein